MSTKPATDGDSHALGLFQAELGRTPDITLSVETAITPECNFNLLEQAKYFLKLIAIFVDFA